jgi:hypothetical protein
VLVGGAESPGGRDVIRLLGGVLVGLLAVRLAWRMSAPMFSVSALVRTNYRGRTVPTAVGLLLPVALLMVEAGRALAGALGAGSAAISTDRVLVIATALGFALVGAVDDVAGDDRHRGLRGHLGALAAGRMTTGMFKLVAGAALAIVVVAPIDGRAPGRLLADAALVALAANVGNLLDLAPGRVIKAAVATFAVVALLARVRAVLADVAVVIGAGFGLLGDDLGERLMLGDAGANVLGAVMGLGLVLSTRPAVRTVALVVVAILNLLGEVASFTRVIDAVPPLRALDRAGRRR